jgi:hypothetical protein
LILTGGELKDHPGWWKINGRPEGESKGWSFLRKPDGTFWEVAGEHFFPPGGPLVRIDIGDEITTPGTVAECRKYYGQFQSTLAKRRSGDSISGDV